MAYQHPSEDHVSDRCGGRGQCELHIVQCRSRLHDIVPQPDCGALKIQRTHTPKKTKRLPGGACAAYAYGAPLNSEEERTNWIPFVTAQRSHRSCQRSHRGYHRDVMEPEPLPNYVLRNRAYWDEANAPRYAEPGRRAWASDEFTWGIFKMPESDLRALPDDLAGRDVIELGCGTAYVSAWLARRGARPFAVDPTPTQLEIAREPAGQRLGSRSRSSRAAGEQVPLPNRAFDFIISEYGAAIWADPYAWIPEAARLLRPGGELVFLGTARC